MKVTFLLFRQIQRVEKHFKNVERFGDMTRLCLNFKRKRQKLGDDRRSGEAVGRVVFIHRPEARKYDVTRHELPT